ncbi:MAG: GYD domain-containing protein [Nocardioidaceae bacterium]
MPRYLFKATYTIEGAKGLLAEGGKARRDVIARAAESVGGRMETFDFAFGEHDVYLICEVPDHAAAAKVALTVKAAGGATVETVVLISPEEIASTADDVAYTPPGG